MKKILTILLFAISTVSFAQYGHYHGHRHHHGHNNWGWVAPALIGGAAVYAITRPPVVQQPPVVIQQPSDIVYIDGVAYRKQLMLVNGSYQEVLIRM